MNGTISVCSQADLKRWRKKKMLFLLPLQTKSSWLTRAYRWFLLQLKSHESTQKSSSACYWLTHWSIFKAPVELSASAAYPVHSLCTDMCWRSLSATTACRHSSLPCVCASLERPLMKRAGLSRNWVSSPLLIHHKVRKAKVVKHTGFQPFCS